MLFATSHEHPDLFENGVSVVGGGEYHSKAEVGGQRYQGVPSAVCIVAGMVSTLTGGVLVEFFRGACHEVSMCNFSAIGRDRGSAGEEPQAANTLVTVRYLR